MLRWSSARLTDGFFEPLLADAGLPPRQRILLESGHSPLFDLLPVSPSVVPEDPLWRGRVVQTGYWFLDMPHFEPEPGLAAFLAGGEPPLVVTFGSMTGMDAQAVTARVGEAAARTGQRVLLQAGWAGLGWGALPANVYCIGHVPHDWLFARARAVIHHGGAGTTAAALRAGVPQAVVWHWGDQQWWGQLLWRQGLAPGKPLWQSSLSSEWLEHTMRALGTDSGLRDRARVLGDRVRAEDGVGQAVKALGTVR